MNDPVSAPTVPGKDSHIAGPHKGDNSLDPPGQDQPAESRPLLGRKPASAQHPATDPAPKSHPTPRPCPIPISSALLRADHKALEAYNCLHSNSPSRLWTISGVKAPHRHSYSQRTLLSLRPSASSPPNLPANLRRPCAPSHSIDVSLSPSTAHLSFADLSLSTSILQALRGLNFQKPSPVQLVVLPVARLGADVIVRAKSGTGKTLVYAIVAVEVSAIPSKDVINSLIIVPTRELARQVADLIIHLGQKKVIVLVGGSPEQHDIAKIASGARIAVCTPGRVLKLLQRGILDGSRVKMLVLDEVDKLIDGGMGDSVRDISSKFGIYVQTLAFSATLGGGVDVLLREVMREPKYFKVGNDRDETDHQGEFADSVLLAVQQRKLKANDKGIKRKARKKVAVLKQILQERPFGFCVVFLNDKNQCVSLAKEIKRWGHSCRCINANIAQSDRVRTMEAVKEGKIRVLVATDLISRGISIGTCDLVVHLDVPSDVATYLHRVGRAGRFGTHGLSILIWGTGDESRLKGLELGVGFMLEKYELSPNQNVLKAHPRKDQVVRKRDEVGTLVAANMTSSTEDAQERVTSLLPKDLQSPSKASINVHLKTGTANMDSSEKSKEADIIKASQTNSMEICPAPREEIEGIHETGDNRASGSRTREDDCMVIEGSSQDISDTNLNLHAVSQREDANNKTPRTEVEQQASVKRAKWTKAGVSEPISGNLSDKALQAYREGYMEGYRQASQVAKRLRKRLGLQL